MEGNTTAGRCSPCSQLLQTQVDYRVLTRLARIGHTDLELKQRTGANQRFACKACGSALLFNPLNGWKTA